MSQTALPSRPTKAAGLRAEVVNAKAIRLFRGELHIGTVYQARFDGSWTSQVNSTARRASRASYKTAEECARARWGAAGVAALAAAEAR